MPAPASSGQLENLFRVEDPQLCILSDHPLIECSRGWGWGRVICYVWSVQNVLSIKCSDLRGGSLGGI